MNTKISIVSMLSVFALHAQCLDISGIVQDKFENPLPGVKVCAQGFTKCVVSATDGKFRYSEGGTALRPLDPALLSATLHFEGGAPIFMAPEFGLANFSWTNAKGAALAPTISMTLQRGANRLDKPASLPLSGLSILSVRGTGYALVFKVLLSGNSGTQANNAPLGAFIAAAAKSAGAAASLDLTLDKYQPKTYATVKEVETGVIIEMRPLGDKILFGGTSLDAWGDFSNGAWKVANGILSHRGGSGALYTKENFGNFRLVTTSRKPGGGHNPNFLLWCKAGSTDKRTLGGIQFQPPLGHMWDYVTNQDPDGITMTRLGSTSSLKVDQWARCETLAKVSTSTLRFACCNLEGTKKTCTAAENVKFTDPKFARSGPFALMIHDDGQQQDYKDIEIEVDPIEPDRLLSVKK